MSALDAYRARLFGRRLGYNGIMTGSLNMSLSEYNLSAFSYTDCHAACHVIKLYDT